MVVPILAVLSKSQRMFGIVIFTIFLTTFILFFITSADQSEIFFFPQYRVWELGLGSLCSLIEQRKWSFLGILKGKVFPYIGVIGILFSIILMASKDWPNYFATIPVFSTFLILFNSNNMNVLNSSFLTFFGKRSYSFYLVHYPIISFSYYIVGFSMTSTNISSRFSYF